MALAASDSDYARFRENMLRSMAGAGQLLHQESRGASCSDHERRKKNNEAAKRSRDSRRAKEDEVAIRAAFLEQENLQLRWEAARLKSETTRLRAILLADSS